MRNTTSIFLSIVPAFLAVFLWNSAAVATPEVSEKLKKECTVCHTEEGSPDLNATGKFYQKNKKLPPAAPKK